MKILHVITSLRIGGAEKLMVDLLPRLRDLGNEVELAVFYGAQTQFVEQLEEAGIKIHKFSMHSNVYHLNNLIKLRSFFNEFDIIHTHNTACQLYGTIASLLKKQMLCTTEHSTSNRRRKSIWLSFFAIHRFEHQQVLKVKDRYFCYCFFPAES